MGAGSIPSQGTNIPHDSHSKKQNVKQYCNKFNKDIKNGPHQKKIKKKDHSKMASLAIVFFF